MKIPTVSSVRFTPGAGRDVGSGLLGYVRIRYGDVVLDGLAVRRTATGALALSWPAKRSRRRRTAHAIVRPSNDAARRELEREILTRLREQGDLP